MTAVHAQNIPINYNITQKALLAHVAFLTSDTLEGRLAGTRGEMLATQYAADFFQRLGLEPDGDNGSFFQTFAFTSDVQLGKNNILAITNFTKTKKHLILNQDWRPLAFSDNRSFTSPQLVFVGYGITAPALGKLPAYDSYHGVNVKDKWVIVFRYLPEKINDKQYRQLSPYSSLRYKTFLAKKNGAKGIIFVSGPNSKVKNQLISFGFTSSNSGIIAISVKDTIVNELLQNSHVSLQTLQNKLDTGHLIPAVSLADNKLIGQIDLQKKKQFGRNVLARLRISKNSASTIIIGAHIDHLGRDKLIHPGADDNASGVASVLEMAAKFTNLKMQGKLRGDKDILFAIWSGEELGLLGSSHFVKNFMQRAAKKTLRPNINTYINLDMVGRLSNHLAVQGVSSSIAWPQLLAASKQKYNISLTLQNDPYLPTDSTSFYLHGVPTINFFTGSHNEYHTPNDKIETLNFEGLKNISLFLISLVTSLEASPILLTYQYVPKPIHAKRGFRIYLGTIPDYASTEPTGIKLSGVTKNSPADYAGLRQNDVILTLAGKKIHDLYDYTFVLNALHAGEPVALVVKRGPKQLTLMIVPQSQA